MINILKKFFNKEEVQDEFAMGVMPDAPDNRDVQYDELATAMNLPEEYFVDIDNVEKLDQKRNGSCVGHAGAHLRMAHDDKRNLELSARYLYAMCKLLDGRPNNEGTYPRILAKVLTGFGVCRDRYVENDSRLKHRDYITVDFKDERTIRDALKHKFKGFASLNVRDIDLLKQAIVKEGGFVLSMRVGNWKGKYLYPDYPDSDREKRNARHMVYVYGYKGDDFYILNSWGRRWGAHRNGTGIFNYKDYANDLFTAYTFSELVTPKVIEKARAKRFIFGRIMYYGMRGEDVKQLQIRLNEENSTTQPTTGYYGRITKDNVKLYQARNGLLPDGFVGRITLNKLNS